MNKLFSKIAALSVGLTMAIGVGVAVGSKSARVVKADNYTYEGSSHDYGDWSYAASKGSGNNDPTATRLYANNILEFTSSGSAFSEVIVNLTINANSKGKFPGEPTISAGSVSGYPTAAGTGKSFTISLDDNVTSFTVTLGGTAGNWEIKSFDITWAGETDVLESITVTGSMSKTAYYVGESWSPTGLVATGHYQTAGDKDISDKVTWSYSPASPALNVTSVVATATLGTVSGNSSAQTVSVSKANQIQVIYTKTSGSVDVYGYYVGFLDGTGPVIMDGAYGIVIYKKDADVSSYTVGETILHVSGSISIYRGLYEIASATINVASGSYEAPEAPVVYAVKGGETEEYASRLTTVTGVPSVTGTFPESAGSSDITITMTIGSEKTVQVFYKKAAQTADAEAFAAMKAAVEGSSEITVKGFTGWHNGFQVQMNGYIPPAEGYTAEDFAQDLLDQTDDVCAGWEEGVNNHDALEAIWSNLASNDKYPSLPADQKTILAEAERDESGTVVEQAMARYDFLTGKYSLSNFINGRTPIVPAGMMNYSDITAGNNTIVIVIVIAAVSALAFTTLLVFKKKKQK